MQTARLSGMHYNGLASQRCCGSRPTQPMTAGARIGGRLNLVIEARQLTRREQTEKKHKRIRNRVSGTPERPRLAVFRSNQHIYAQVIDDEAGSTLAAASTLSPEIRQALAGACANNEEAAKMVGVKIAELCKQKNIEKVCFDRGGFRYHGRVQALADAAREGGLSF